MTSINIAGWLRNLGLDQYEPAFRANEIDARVLPSLTAEDLKDLGVNLVGHRRRLLDAIAALGAEPSAPHDALTRAEPERRQLTVMFCDLVGSTELSARPDPEDLSEFITAYHRAVAEVVRRFDGFVAKYMGDGVLVYCGCPRRPKRRSSAEIHPESGECRITGRRYKWVTPAELPLHFYRSSS